MNRLQSFLKENALEVKSKKEVYISNRFKDENGEVVPFTIKLLSKNEITACQNALLDHSKKGKADIRLDRYHQALAIMGTVEPDLQNASLQDSYGVTNPDELLDRMLTGPEFMKLTQEIISFNDLDRDINDDIEEAKN